MNRSALAIPALGYALLGLLQPKPASGYDLRKIFSSTSMRTYSDSPGAIYPALNRLEKQGLIRGSIVAGAGLRRRQVFRVTANGLSQLKQWITRPVTHEDVAGGPQEVMLRFACSEIAVGRAAAIELLRSLQAALQTHVKTLRQEQQGIQPGSPTSARLAFECGVRANRTLLDWTHYALATYEKEKGGTS